MISPNTISLFRILLTPIVLALILYDIDYIGEYYQRYLTGSLFVLISFTDFLDGYIARTYNMQSTLGEILDPLADKMLVSGAMLALVSTGEMNIWYVFTIISREFLITGIRVVLAGKNVSISSSFLGKSKTVVQMFAIGFAIMNWVGANELLILATIFSVYSAYEYVRDAKEHLV